MIYALLLLAAANPIHFDISDGRGKRPSGVSVEPGPADSDGWMRLSVARSKKPVRIVWPFDGEVKTGDGPGSIPVIVIEPDAPVTDLRARTAILAGRLLGMSGEGLPDPGPGDPAAADPFESGVALLAAGKPAEAAEPLGRALRDRERQLTRVPSEICAAAMLEGKALFDAGKFDDAAVAYLKALRQRPSDPAAHEARRAALIKAGKPEAADQ